MKGSCVSGMFLLSFYVSISKFKSIFINFIKYIYRNVLLKLSTGIKVLSNAFEK